MKTQEALFERLMIAGNHLASALVGTCIPSECNSYQDALQAHGQPYADMWIAWRAIMDIRDAAEPHEAL